ncbi:MAG: hypothetical protein NTX79_08170 [Candidatus Micrarchaeota archaeon]|nr:hypothetical protein [Candidatus Micrarchaeota archaeon]
MAADDAGMAKLDCESMDANKTRIAIFLFLSLAVLLPSMLGASTPFTCDPAQFSDTMQVCAIAAIAMFAIIALVYIGGEATQSPRMLTWAKSESVQAFTSLAIVSILIFAVFSLCSFQVGEMQTIFGLSAMPKIYQSAPSPYDNGKDSLYTGAMRYIENLAALALGNIASLRYDLGAYELRTSFNTFLCDGICIFSLSSTSVSYFGGESMNLAITNNLLGTATVSYLSVIFQYFTLVYIYNGLFLTFLPIAMIIRSVPFMRHFGGSLIAIFVALYIMYPLMLVADAYIAPGLAASGASPAVMCGRDSLNCQGIGVFSTSTQTGAVCKQGEDPCFGKSNEWGMEGKWQQSDLSGLSPNTLGRAIPFNVLIFLTAVFLPALNFIVIAAFGRELSRLLGEEADMSRLGQMI